ncbi:MAG: hypothetical protein AAGF28_08960 [Pseudomonadota bacterium]
MNSKRIASSLKALALLVGVSLASGWAPASIAAQAETEEQAVFFEHTTVSGLSLIERRRLRRQRAFEARRRDFGKTRGRLPQRHIDYCIRLNMGYNVRNNTIDVDKFFKQECASPYYTPPYTGLRGG